MKIRNAIEMTAALLSVPVTFSISYFLFVTGNFDLVLLASAVAIALHVISSADERRWAQWRADVKAGRREAVDLPS